MHRLVMSKLLLKPRMYRLVIILRILLLPWEVEVEVEVEVQEEEEAGE
jgi:hypothetical protein